ncbi:MAG TPA: M56 family metallopeptidase [Terracidiphilus sp.]|nr:M56 family metallopeptidase [Terracidiphilus sp.]
MSTFPIIFSLYHQLLAQLLHSGQLCPLLHWFWSFTHWAGPVAVTALWQGAVVAAGLALCLRFAPRVAASHRFAAWAAGFCALVALPFVPAFSQLLALSGSANGNASASLPQTAHPFLSLNAGWSLAIAALWLVIALVRAGDLAIHTVRLRKLWKSATPVEMDAALRMVLSADSARRLRKLTLCTTSELDRPSVIGFFAPRILIPDWLFNKLTRQELEQVVLHEAEHLRRGDDWTNLLQKLCLVVFPLNLALVFVEQRLCREREMACDEGVVRRTQAPRAYAACLAGLAERHMEHRAEALSLGARAKALALNAFDRRPELARRVHSLLAERSALHPVASRAVLGALSCALAVGAVELARCPQLIAFVPSAPKIAAETAQSSATDLVTDRHAQQAVSGFHAINAMAIMPQTVRQRIANRQAETQQSAIDARCSRARNTSILRSAINAAQSVNASVPATIADNAKAIAPVRQELVVFTSYEQVQRTSDGLGDKVISDFGAESSAIPLRGNAGPARITVTHLVFRIFPAAQTQFSLTPAADTTPGTTTKPSAQAASPATDSTAGQAAQHALDPTTTLPRTISLGNGWFVIQL